MPPHLGEVALQGVGRHERAGRLARHDLGRDRGLVRGAQLTLGVVGIDDLGLDHLGRVLDRLDGLGLELLDLLGVFDLGCAGGRGRFRAACGRGARCASLRWWLRPHSASPSRGLLAYALSSCSTASRAPSGRSGTWIMART